MGEFKSNMFVGSESCLNKMDMLPEESGYIALVSAEREVEIVRYDCEGDMVERISQDYPEKWNELEIGLYGWFKISFWGFCNG